MSKDDKRFGLGSGGSTFNDKGDGLPVDRSEMPYPNGKTTVIADIKRMIKENFKNK